MVRALPLRYCGPRGALETGRAAVRDGLENHGLVPQWGVVRAVAAQLAGGDLLGLGGARTAACTTPWHKTRRRHSRRNSSGLLGRRHPPGPPWLPQAGRLYARRPLSVLARAARGVAGARRGLDGD